jgi:myo-inositol-1(or 4)-monophosphatase
VNYEKELVFVKSLALEAGGVMRHYFRSQETKTSWKQKNDPLTVADTTINSLVIERIKKEFPTHGVLGEEETYRPDAEKIWVVDPIDGTLPFVLGLPTAVFMAAFVVDGRPVVGVIYNPWMDLLYWAVKGKGAFCNERKLMIAKSDTKVVELMRWKGSVYRSKTTSMTDNLEAAGLSPQNMIGGIAKTAVLENHMYGLVYADDSPWDMAPFDLLVHEAGGLVTDLDGNTLEFRGPIKGTVAGSHDAHAELLRLLHKP